MGWRRNRGKQRDRAGRSERKSDGDSLQNTLNLPNEPNYDNSQIPLSPKSQMTGDGKLQSWKVINPAACRSTPFDVFLFRIDYSSGKVGTIGSIEEEKKKKKKHPNALLVVLAEGPLSKTKGKAAGLPQVPPSIASSVSGADDSWEEPMTKLSTPPLDATNSTLESLSPDKSPFVMAIPYDSSLGLYVPETEKDDKILTLVSLMQKEQTRIEYWTEWGSEKVKQATQRLNEEQMKSPEEYEAEFISLFESNMNVLNVQMKEGRCELISLYFDNNRQKKELKAVKSQDRKAEEDLQEARKREQQTQNDARSIQSQRCVFLEELRAQKQKVTELERELSQKVDLYGQSEVEWIQAEIFKEIFLAQAASIRKEREEIEGGTEAEEARIREKAKDDHRKYMKSEAYGRWECYICLREAVSVVWLPCNHQVLCASCDEVIQKFGTTNCLSCSIPVKRKLHALFAQL